jgi:hypothetical protein
VGLLVLVLAVSSTAPAASSTPGTWAKTGSMTTPRDGQTAIVLGNGQVLVMGGSNSSGALSSAELFNPATGKWTATGNMGAARSGFTATLLQNGQVLVAGGDVAGAVTSSAELFNPSSGTFTATGSMSTPPESRDSHAAAGRRLEGCTLTMLLAASGRNPRQQLTGTTCCGTAPRGAWEAGATRSSRA